MEMVAQAAGGVVCAEDPGFDLGAEGLERKFGVGGNERFARGQGLEARAQVGEVEFGGAEFAG